MCVCVSACAATGCLSTALCTCLPIVGLEEGEYKYKLSLCYSIVYYYNGAQRYEQFFQVG